MKKNLQVPARNLLRWNRFDLPFKYLYATSRLRGLQTSFYEAMYRHHLEVWNNFSEHDNESKNGYQAFKSVFDKLIDDIGAFGFDTTMPSVPITEDGYLLNGAHRVAACIASGKDVYCVEGEDRVDGQMDCSWAFFMQHTRFGCLDSKYSDLAAIELAKSSPSSRIVTLYPSAVNEGKTDEVRSILANNNRVIYEKQVNISLKGASNLMRELYYKEAWAEKNNGEGYSAKAGFCFKPKGLFRNKVSPTHTFLIEIEDDASAVSLKDEIRNLYGIGKHSVHINDTHEETVRLAKCFYNQNSIDFLNRFNGRLFPLYESLLSEFEGWISQNELDSENYCISAGSVLTAFGLKECKDIDYLHSNEKAYTGNYLIQSHNDYGIGRYHVHRDDIIHNPDNYFYRYGVKYSSLDVVKKLKKRRGEDKDFRDIRLINSIL